MSASIQAEQPRPDPEPVETSRQMTWQEHQAAGDEAWDQALERTKILRPEGGAEGSEDLVPLDETTIGLYEQANRHLRAMIFLGPDGPTDPFTLLKLGGSQAALAEATPLGVFEEGWRTDKQSGLQEAARTNLQKAATMLMGEEYQPAQDLADKIAAVNPSEVMAGAAVEAAKETSTAEHVAVVGIAKAADITPQSLEAEGVEGMERYIWAHGGAPDSGPEFMLRLTTKAVEQLTGEHELPSYAARDEPVEA